MTKTTTWRDLISKEMYNNGDGWPDVVHVSPGADLGRTFNAGHGGSEGDPFTLWTRQYVYFPVTYDGAEWVGSVPREPCDKATAHVGGE